MQTIVPRISGTPPVCRAIVMAREDVEAFQCLLRVLFLNRFRAESRRLREGFLRGLGRYSLQRAGYEHSDYSRFKYYARPRELYDHQRFELRVPLSPWPAWAAFGGSVDMTINAPSQVLYNPTAGLGKNLGVGYFYGPDGPQGISLSLGPSVGPPLNVSLPTPNTCTRLAN